MEESGKDRCETCGRFDKTNRLEKACEKLFKEFLDSGNHGNLIVRGPGCSIYWETYLAGLITRESFGVRLNIVNGDYEGDAFNLKDYCS